MSDFAWVQLGVTAAAILVFIVLNRLMRTLMQSYARYKKVSEIRVEHIVSYFKFVLFIVLLVFILAIWGIDYKGLLVFASSLLAVLGVALFAQWSLLSNITAGVIIFFSFPARIGDKIEIIDGKDSVTGTIIEINIFQVLLKDEDGAEISYPNSLLLQRPVRKVEVDGECQKVVENAKRWHSARLASRLRQRK